MDGFTFPKLLNNTFMLELLGQDFNLHIQIEQVFLQQFVFLLLECRLDTVQNSAEILFQFRDFGLQMGIGVTIGDFIGTVQVDQ